MSKHFVIGTLLFVNGLAWLAGSPIGAAGNGTGGPYGSMFDFELLAAEHSSAVGSYYRLSTGPGSFTLHFDGTPESLPSYCCGLATTPSVNESFTDNGDGTSTVEIIAISPNGTDLYPSGMLGEGNVPETDAGLRIGHPHGFFSDSIPLTWNPPHAVLSATVDLKLSNGTSVYGGPYVLSPSTFFGAPGPWGGSLAVVFPNQVGKGITTVDLRIVVPSSNSGGGACVADATTLCLSNSRFKVKVAWQALHLGTNGTGQAVPLTSDTGYFWFFGNSNVELVIKVVDGTTVNGHFWVFYGALSNVQYTITVTDTKTGLSKTYFNPQDTLASAADTSAFSGSSAAPIKTDAIAVPAISAEELLASAVPRLEPAASAQLAAGCAADATTLCLSSGRFKVQVAWRAVHLGTSGTGQAVPLTSDTGYFWFFGSSNVELIIKVVDGTPVNGKFWVFYGALSNVQYTIQVTDMVTGMVRNYSNPSDTLASVADTSAFPPSVSARPEINSLGLTDALPFTLLTITGSGFDPAAELSVRFFDDRGFSVKVPLVAVTATSVTVAVPPYLDARTGEISSGYVNVQVIKTTGTASLPSSTLGGFHIQGLPIPTAPPGAITLSLLKASVRAAQSLQNGIKGTSLDTPALNAALSKEITDLSSFMASVQAVVQNQSLSVSLGSVSGKEVTINASSLRSSDQMIIGMALALANASAAPLTEEGSPSLHLDSTSAGCMGTEASAFAQGAIQGDPELDRLAQDVLGAPNQSLACRTADSFGLGSKVVFGTAAVAIGLTVLVATAVASSEVALAAVALSSAMVLAATIEGAGGMIAVGGALGQSNSDAVKLVQSGVDQFNELLLGTFKVLVPETVGASILTLLGANSLVEAFTSAPPFNSGNDGCTYTYSDWSPCQPGNIQTRTVLSSSPPGCVGTPVLSQSCTSSVKYCINEWDWIDYPPWDWDTSKWYGSNTVGQYPTGSPECAIYPFVAGCITTFTYSCSSSVYPDPCGAICSP